MYFPTVTHTLQ